MKKIVHSLFFLLISCSLYSAERFFTFNECGIFVDEASQAMNAFEIKKLGADMFTVRLNYVDGTYEDFVGTTVSANKVAVSIVGIWLYDNSDRKLNISIYAKQDERDSYIDWFDNECLKNQSVGSAISFEANYIDDANPFKGRPVLKCEI